MAETLLSVGLDVGTTTTQLVVSRITVENRASGFAVPEMDITGREILYESPVRFTPLVGENLVDGDKIARIVEEEYKNAGIEPGQVDSGAVIVTGETSRKENAAAVAQGLSALAGEFVVATAGPDLESVLAAKGAGAVDVSQRTGKTVLHIDIGGGTSNLALIREGKVAATGCLNVGGRLVKVQDGKITYVSTVVKHLWETDFPSSGTADAAPPSPQGEGIGPMEVGEPADIRKLEALARVLVQALEMAAGLREKTELWDALWTKECGNDLFSLPQSACSADSPLVISARRRYASEQPGEARLLASRRGGQWVVSFSGGVADCIDKDMEPFVFGDMGPILGKAIRQSRLCRGEYMLGKQTIRATVIGAGCHSAQLSGSTVFCRGVRLPMKNLPVAVVSQEEQHRPEAIARALSQTDAPVAVLAAPGIAAPSYGQVQALAEAILEGFGDRQILVCLQEDMAKALGQRICLEGGGDCLCIDRVRLEQGSFLDVGQPVGPCMPVVVKTLVFNG